MNEQIALARSNQRCEWRSLIGERCQNTMSLKFHHRTYDHFGNESPEDFSVFCPAHHFIADMYRKQFVGQREDVICERMSHILWDKIRGFDEQKKIKIVSRIAREWDAFWDDHLVGEVVIKRYIELVNSGSVSIYGVYLSNADIDYVLLSIRYIEMLNRIVFLPELDQLNQVNAFIEDKLTAVL